jgi:hypothetical protein
LQQRLDETEIAAAKYVTLTELAPIEGASRRDADPAALLRATDAGSLEHEGFESIYTAGKLLLLQSWRDLAAAEGWSPRTVAGYALRHRRVRIIRDYGMFDRREAPQYYPAVRR